MRLQRFSADPPFSRVILAGSLPAFLLACIPHPFLTECRRREPAWRGRAERQRAMGATLAQKVKQYDY